MEVSTKDIMELFGLLNKTLDGALDQAQKVRLEQMLLRNPSLHSYYVKFFLLSSELRDCLSISEVKLSGHDIDGNMTSMDKTSQKVLADIFEGENIEFDQGHINKIRQQAERQLQAFLDEQERQRIEQQRQQCRLNRRFNLDFTSVIKKTGTVATFIGKSVVILAACVIIMLIVMSLVNQYQLHRVVATLGDSVHARWADSPETIELRPGSMNLEQGFAEIIFTKGARVIVQAPCNFTLCSPSKMSVEEGTIIAKVPREAIGFTIDTRNSSIKDFGTEFGVMVDSQARTEVHVFDGLIQLRSSGQGRSGRNQWELTRGRTAIVDNSGNLEIGSVQDRPRLFVHSLPDANQLGIPGQCLDMADIVGGGNGLGTGKLGYGLHPQTGARVPEHSVVFGRTSGYVETPHYEFIDGVFIPDGENKESITISSTGLQFPGCPDTSGICAHTIRHGIRFQHEQSITNLGKIRGRTYGIPGHPAISMHANAGITFDLDKIRSIHSSSRIVRFSSLCGISETVAEYSDGYWKSQRIKVGFWVFVDGQLRFSRELIAVPAQCAEIDIPLLDKDRFLTLITTECNPDRSFAWALFAEPILELKSRREINSSIEPLQKEVGYGL